MVQVLFRFRGGTLLIALIDADILIYKFNYRNEFSIEWEEGVESSVLDPDKAKADLDNYVNWIVETTASDDYMMILTGSNNFRYKVLPSYKHNRKDVAKPAMFQILKDYIMEKHPHKIKDGLEGDDVMGIMATKKPGKYIVCSIDKDLLQIPGLHYNWNKNKFTEVSLAEGNRFFYQQIMTGDPTDGYPGCPGLGKKRAIQILDKAEADYAEKKPDVTLEQHIWNRIVWFYTQNSLDEQYALKQARVARILRAEDFNFKTSKPKLWLPR